MSDDISRMQKELEDIRASMSHSERESSVHRSRITEELSDIRIKLAVQTMVYSESQKKIESIDTKMDSMIGQESQRVGRDALLNRITQPIIMIMVSVGAAYLMVKFGLR